MTDFIATVRIKHEPKTGPKIVIQPGESCDRLPEKTLEWGLGRGYIKANDRIDDGLILSQLKSEIDLNAGESENPQFDEEFEDSPFDEREDT